MGPPIVHRCWHPFRMQNMLNSFDRGYRPLWRTQPPANGCNPSGMNAARTSIQLLLTSC